jgi:hypothetical protein
LFHIILKPKPQTPQLAQVAFYLKAAIADFAASIFFMQFLGFINRPLMMRHDPMKTESCHHASSLLQTVFGLLPVGGFFNSFPPGSRYPNQLATSIRSVNSS